MQLVRIDLTTIILALVGVVTLCLAILTLIKMRVQRRAARTLFLYLLFQFIWTFTALATIQGWLRFWAADFVWRLPLYGLLILSIPLQQYIRVYLGSKNSGAWWWVFGGMFSAALLFLDMNPLGFPERLWSGYGWVVLRQGVVLSGIPVGWGIFMGTAAQSVWSALSQSKHPVRRNRYRYLVPVLLAVVLGSGLIFAGFWSLGGIIGLSGAVWAAFATLKPRLPALRSISLRLVSYLVRATTAVFFFILIFSLPPILEKYRIPAGSQTLRLALAVLAGIVLLPVLNRLLSLADRLIVTGRLDKTRVVRRFSQNISHILDSELLAKVSLETLQESFGIRRGYLFVIESGKQEGIGICFYLRCVGGLEDDCPEIFTLSAASPLANYLCFARRPVTQFDLDVHPRFSGISAEERAWLADLDLDIYVPVFAQDEWIGLLALGPTASGAPYLDDDQELLCTLADQTAVALENSRLVDSLMRLNREFQLAYKALDRVNYQLEQLDQTKSDFISIASHELGTPLTLLLGYSQMLVDDPDLLTNPAHKEMIASIHLSARRMKEIVESMLDMAKIDARVLKITPQPISLRDLFVSLREELQPALAERNQQLELDNLRTLPAVEADREGIYKVFYHLAMNAIKYTPDGGRITISGRQVLPSPETMKKGAVEIVVSDTGVGIDPDLHELIFTKFYQTGELALHASGKTKFKRSGPGLGLAIAKGIVDAHKGRIWVDSPGYDEVKCPGSKFHVVLPLCFEPLIEPENPLLKAA